MGQGWEHRNYAKTICWDGNTEFMPKLLSDQKIGNVKSQLLFITRSDADNLGRGPPVCPITIGDFFF